MKIRILNGFAAIVGLAGVVGVVGLGVQRAEAAIYTEAPDFSDFIATPTPLTLDMGTNTITGHVDFLAGDLRDIFEVTLPVDCTIASITVHSFDYENQGGNGAWCTFSTPSNSYTGLFGGNSAGNITFQAPGAFLSRRVFGMGAGAIFSNGFISQGSAVSYTLTFNITPTPGSAALLSMGSLAMLRRRRR